ncbi:MAG: hypothetical protein KVP17_004698 [Porospora cf. gigantea B]|uniref:uncharacterized protein n=1 Tax=Porospora cf. gigantea B TaxID=2853592 RepID=UPI003571F51D|nr:MAG: hypothetical protein KVP17_004698 [Porospora cf. gigantea B]
MMRNALMNAPIVLLKDGADTSQGRGQIVANINACQAVADMLRTTLGPRGMDKMIENARKEATITNDGATVMHELNVIHPAARMLVDIAQAQDEEIGDGTTSVVLLAAELLQEAKSLLEEGVHPLIIVKGYQFACKHALDCVKRIQVGLSNDTAESRRDLLIKCAQTAMNSKIVANNKDFFGELVVDAVMYLEEDLNQAYIGLKKVSGGSLTDSFLVDGVAFPKTFSYAGFQQQPKNFTNPRVLLLNLELELKAEKENAEVRIEGPQDYQSIIDAEWNLIYQKLHAIHDAGVHVVLSKQPIGDLATQFFADRGMFCAGRVSEDDLMRTAKATGAQIQTTVRQLSLDVLGTCGVFEERQIGSERYNMFRKCPHTVTSTLVLRGGATQLLDEVERSLHDAIMIVRRSVKTHTIVGGGGAIEMQLSTHLRDLSHSISGKQQVVVSAFAKAMEVIPRTLATNSGLDTTGVLNTLRMIHHGQRKNGVSWAGVDCINGGTCDTMQQFIWEPAAMKINAFSSATEAACVILSVDEVIKNPKSHKEPDGPNAAQAMAGGPGRAMR